MLAQTLDALGARYSVRPSTIMEFASPGRAMMFDIKVASMASLANEVESESVTGQYMAKKRGWPDWAKEELREQGVKI